MLDLTQKQWQILLVIMLLAVVIVNITQMSRESVDGYILAAFILYVIGVVLMLYGITYLVTWGKMMNAIVAFGNSQFFIIASMLIIFVRMLYEWFSRNKKFTSLKYASAITNLVCGAIILVVYHLD